MFEKIIHIRYVYDKYDLYLKLVSENSNPNKFQTEFRMFEIWKSDYIRDNNYTLPCCSNVIRFFSDLGYVVTKLDISETD